MTSNVFSQSMFSFTNSQRLRVEVVVIVSARTSGEHVRVAGCVQIGAAARSVGARRAVGKAEVVAEAARLLQRLRKCLILADVRITDRTPSVLHGLLKMGFGDLGNGVDVFVVVLHGIWVGG